MYNRVVTISLVFCCLLGLFSASARAEGKTVALMAVKPRSGGWGALSPTDGLQLGIGTLLQEAVAQTPGLTLLDWDDTSGTTQMVRSGLYVFQPGNRYAQWRALVSADVFVEYTVSADKLELAVHGANGSAARTVLKPLAQPKQATAILLHLLYAQSGITPPPALLAQIDDPETKDPTLMLTWMCWLNYLPSPFLQVPWQAPNISAGQLIATDHAFARGLAWALPMRLLPSGSGAGAHPANPTEFDLFVLPMLDTRFADGLIPSLRVRIRQNPRLQKTVLTLMNTADGEALPGESAGGDEGGGGEDSNVPGPRSTPRVRLQLCRALAGIEDPAVITALARTVNGDTAVTVRTAATTALGEMKNSPRVIEMLNATASRAPAATVRLAACQALLHLHAVTADLVTQALKDADPAVIAFGIEQLETHRAELPDARQRLAALATHPATLVRQAMLRVAPAIMTDPAELQPLVERALDAPEAVERVQALTIAKKLTLQGLFGVVKKRLTDGDGAVRAAAVETLLALQPAALDGVLATVQKDAQPAVQLALCRGLARLGAARHAALLETWLPSPDPAVRQAACDALYVLAKDDRARSIRTMLKDASQRVNLAAIRLIQHGTQPALLNELIEAVQQHPNEYVRIRALDALDQLNHPVVHDLCVSSLASPYWIVRLYAADILTRRGVPADEAVLAKTLQETEDKWLKPALEDALCKAQGKPAPERTRLHLGQRAHLEGGELPNGWQLWLGVLPADSKEARKLVDEGYRFGRVLPAPAQEYCAIRSWDEYKGLRSMYLVHLRNQFDNLSTVAPYLYYLCLFDEPMAPMGSNTPDEMRAFLLEANRPDLLATYADGKVLNLPPDLRSAYWYVQGKAVGELSNWVVRICRASFQRQYRDLRIFPQMLSYAGLADAFDMLDADGDYTWRYDSSNIFGHYSIGATTRALRPGQPSCMVTWMGWLYPSMFGDAVFTDTVFPDGPWRARGYMGTKATLALYASGIEAGMFNAVAYKPIADRGHDTGNRESFPLTPYSAALEKVVHHDLMDADSKYWNGLKVQYEMDLMKTGPDDQAAPEAGEKAGSADADELKLKAKVKYDKARADAVDRLERGCAWLNLFDTDNTRAFSNLPRVDNSKPCSTLLILPRGANWRNDGAYFSMPAIALAQGFDLAPTYDTVRLVDLNRYDTIMLLDSTEGVTSELVRKINRWLLEKPHGLLYVCGMPTAQTVLFPAVTCDRIEEPFLWEKTVQAAALPTVEEADESKGAKAGAQKTVFPRLSAFQPAGGKVTPDAETRLRFTYTGAITPLLTHDGTALLARWKAPETVKSVVIFDGATEAGPVYTAALEQVVLALDKERGTTIARNSYWGHVSLENNAFTIDVATNGYLTLQNARPRQHHGVDIISGEIDPLVKHNESALILKDYVGPYAGGKGDWAVMARTELHEMTLTDANTLRLVTRGVTRVTHRGPARLALKDATGFEEVKDQLEVWKALWAGKKAFSRNPIPGGQEFHFTSPDPVVIGAE